MNQCMNCGGPVGDRDARCTTCGLHRTKVVFGERAATEPWGGELECPVCGEVMVERPRGPICVNADDYGHERARQDAEEEDRCEICGGPLDESSDDTWCEDCLAEEQGLV